MKKITRRDFFEVVMLVQDVLEEIALGLDFGDQYVSYMSDIAWAIMDEDGETDRERIGIALHKLCICPLPATTIFHSVSGRVF